MTRLQRKMTNLVSKNIVFFIIIVLQLCHVYFKRGTYSSPGQEVRAGSCRKTPEINGNIEAVFQPESLRIFPVISG
jgi:hypothetical protein